MTEQQIHKKDGSIEHYADGRLVAVESDAGDMVARGLAENLDFEPATATLAELVLVPSPFVITCIEGGMGCADCLNPPLASKADAILRGWQDISFEPMAAGTFYFGTCQECAKVLK